MLTTHFPKKKRFTEMRNNVKEIAEILNIHVACTPKLVYYGNANLRTHESSGDLLHICLQLQICFRSCPKANECQKEEKKFRCTAWVGITMVRRCNSKTKIWTSLLKLAHCGEGIWSDFGSKTWLQFSQIDFLRHKYRHIGVVSSHNCRPYQLETSTSPDHMYAYRVYRSHMNVDAIEV